MAIGYGPPLDVIMGEHGDIYTVTNASPSPCTLRGVPTIVLRDGGGAVLAFRYIRGAQYLTHAPPSDIDLEPRHTAYFVLAKYRCHTGSDLTASTTAITLPSTQTPLLTIATNGFARGAPGAGSASLDYCRPGPTDPGNTVEVSPFEPTIADAYGY